jgi:hypothetical protein
MAAISCRRPARGNIVNAGVFNLKGVNPGLAGNQRGQFLGKLRKELALVTVQLFAAFPKGHADEVAGVGVQSLDHVHKPRLPPEQRMNLTGEDPASIGEFLHLEIALDFASKHMAVLLVAFSHRREVLRKTGSTGPPTGDPKA